MLSKHGVVESGTVKIEVRNILNWGIYCNYVHSHYERSSINHDTLSSRDQGGFSPLTTEGKSEYMPPAIFLHHQTIS